MSCRFLCVSVCICVLRVVDPRLIYHTIFIFMFTSKARGRVVVHGKLARNQVTFEVKLG